MSPPFPTFLMTEFKEKLHNSAASHPRSSVATLLYQTASNPPPVAAPPNSAASRPNSVASTLPPNSFPPNSLPTATLTEGMDPLLNFKVGYTVRWEQWRPKTVGQILIILHKIQLHSALTDFRGPTNFFCYRRNSVIANIGDKRKLVMGTENKYLL